MSLGFGMSLRQTVRHEQSLAERQLISQTQALSIRLRLIQALTGKEYKPAADCLKCGRSLSPLEILKGFNNDPKDFTTVCTNCGHRFQPRLQWSNAETSMGFAFFCAIQTRDQLKGLETLSPEELEVTHREVYHSAIAHHGTLKNAFSAMGIDYPHDEVANVKSKVEPFLGKIFDTVIAELSGLKVGVIRRMRQKAGITACTYKSMLESTEGA